MVDQTKAAWQKKDFNWLKDSEEVIKFLANQHGGDPTWKAWIVKACTEAVKAIWDSLEQAERQPVMETRKTASGLLSDNARPGEVIEYAGDYVPDDDINWADV